MRASRTEIFLPIHHKKAIMSQQATRAGQPDRRELANAVRALSMDAVQAANSGHPGAPMGMADIAEVLWNDYLRHNPGNAGWVDRDRFVLSNGHGSMLLYSLLHLTGYDLSMDEIRNFRQFGYRTAGHPEYEPELSIETTTGPLGQGITNAVGMALAEKMLAAEFNKPGLEIVDHRTWVFLGDGCLMEGISHEACSLAGTLKLGKLIALYDDNNISIDGEVGGWFTDDTVKRFEAYGWHVVADVDGHDSAAIASAIDQAMAETHRPSIICWKRSPQCARNWGGTRRRSRFRPTLLRPGTAAQEVLPLRRPGRRCLTNTGRSIRSRRPSFCAACIANYPTAGASSPTRPLRPLTQRARTWRRARHHWWR
jgi:transketolase N-terminal domain/subunit